PVDRAEQAVVDHRRPHDRAPAHVDRAGGRREETASAGVKPLVLCYHAVSETWRHALSVPADELERQLELLVRRGYRPVGAAEIVQGRGKLLHVTFDDAFASVRNALPVLERHGARATV